MNFWNRARLDYDLALLMFSKIQSPEYKKEASNILNNIYRTLPRYLGEDLL